MGRELSVQFTETLDSRHEAARVLEKVADYGQSGNWPHEVTCEQVGRALFRIAINSPEEDPLLGWLNGWHLAERERHTKEQDFTANILRQRDKLMEETGRRDPP